MLGPAAASARADFGFSHVGTAFTNEDGSAATQAGSHPFAWTTAFGFNTRLDSEGTEFPEQQLRDLRIQLPPGLAGALARLPRCSDEDFPAIACPDASAIGTVALQTTQAEPEGTLARVYNLEPQPGTAAEIGFVVLNLAPFRLQVGINSSPPHNLFVSLANASTEKPIYSGVLTVKGTAAGVPLLTLPPSCTGPLSTGFEADSWQRIGTWVSAAAPTPGLSGCDELEFSPTVEARLTASTAQGPSRFDAGIDAANVGLTSPTGRAEADPRRAVLTLPERMTVNPAAGDGLGVCTPADYDRETLAAAPGAGCPEAAKLGSVEVETPLLDRSLGGSLYIAKPDDPATARPGAENPFDSLFAIYAVFKEPALGVFIKHATELEADPLSGRLTATIDEIPQLPFSHFGLQLPAGDGSLLTVPPGCGAHAVHYELTPSSGAPPLEGQTSFTTTQNCAAPAFKPGLTAGATNPLAGAATPFTFDLSRADGEQGLGGLALALPPGLSADFAAVPPCPEALTASGRCPEGSRVGSARIAAGTGPSPLWIPQTGTAAVYLAGPYRGAPFSLVVAVPAQAGPFDLGTVVTRAGIEVDPVSAAATIRFDALPQILSGVPIGYRAIRLSLDRPGFVLNPTSCEAAGLDATITSTSGTVATAARHFQARECGRLPFGPRLRLGFSGATGRNGHPTVTATVTPRPGDAGLRSAALLLPRGTYLDQRNIGGVCTRARFAAGSCPADSIFGRIRASTPLLSRPLQGNLYLREGPHRLPDLAADLNGELHLVLGGRLDTRYARVRASFDRLPDIPLSRLQLVLRAGRHGLLVNSEGLCGRRPRAGAAFTAHNGKRHDLRPRAKAACGERR